MVPKDVKRRFKGIFGNRDENSSSSNQGGNQGSNNNDTESHSPVTYGSSSKESAVDKTAFLPKEESKNSDSNDGLSRGLDYLKSGVKQVSSGVASSAKALKEKVVGKSAKRATLVEDDDDDHEDPCHYAELDANNKDKNVSEAVRADMKTTRIWTPSGPILIDEHGNKISDPKQQTQKKPETYDASKDDTEESPVAILSADVNYDESAAIMDPSAEDKNSSSAHSSSQRYASMGNEPSTGSDSATADAVVSPLKKLYA